MSLFFKICNSLFILPLFQLLLPTEALFCHFRGSFLWQVFPLTNFLIFSLDGIGVDLSEGSRGPWGWSGGGGDPSAPRPLPSLFSSPSAPPAHLLTHPNIPGWGEPQTPRTPGAAGSCFTHSREWDPPPLPLGWGQGCCRPAGTSEMGFASASQRWGCQPSKGLPHPSLPSSRATEEGEVPALGFILPSGHGSFSHCDFAQLPTRAWCG